MGIVLGLQRVIVRRNEGYLKVNNNTSNMKLQWDGKSGHLSHYFFVMIETPHAGTRSCRSYFRAHMPPRSPSNTLGWGDFIGQSALGIMIKKK